jgi:sarcosine oxidase, subunit gamma
MAAMHPEAMARDPLAARIGDLARIERITHGAVRARHEPFTTQVNLRLDPSLATSLPFPLPTAPNTLASGQGKTALWLGPDEWLVMDAPHTGNDLADELDHFLGDHHRSVVDVSANRVAITLIGFGALDLLAKGCSLDLHPRSWRVGMCAQTLLAKAQVIVFQRSGATTTILVRTSFADYLVEWLLAAANQLDGTSPGRRVPT